MRSLVYLSTSDVSSARPDHECSQELAYKIVAAKLARPIGRHTIQLLVEESWRWVKNTVRAMVETIHPVRGAYIPEKMPPREVAGCKFVEPRSEYWRSQISKSPYRFRAIPLREQTV